MGALEASYGDRAKTRIKPEPAHSGRVESAALSVKQRPSQAVLVVTTTRALQRDRPTKPNPPMAVRFVATEILSSADGLSARRA